MLARSIVPPRASTAATSRPASLYSVKSAFDRRVGTCTTAHAGASALASRPRMFRFTPLARASYDTAINE